MAAGETTLSTEDENSEQANRVLIHDFRNLLAVIVNYSELIAQETDDPEALRADIGEVRTAAERAIVLTDTLRRRLLHLPEPAAVPEETPPASTA
jgi:signal transduction histidine kinase